MLKRRAYPLTDIYLRSDRDSQAGKTGSLSNLYIFSFIAIFILVLACINFINLTTARASTRAKEVAVKKVAGAMRGQMIAQFFTESFLMTTLSLTLGIVLSFLLLPYFSVFSGKTLQMDIFSPLHVSVLLAVSLVIGILSGSYPAFVLSRFKPVAALKDKIKISPWTIGIKKGLVVFQFAVSVVLIVSSTIVYTQMNFLQNHDFGFKPAQTMVIDFEGDRMVQGKIAIIKEQLLRVKGVEGITVS